MELLKLIIVLVMFGILMFVLGVILPNWLLGDDWGHRNDGADANKGLIIMIIGIAISVFITLYIVDIGDLYYSF